MYSAKKRNFSHKSIRRKESDFGDMGRRPLELSNRMLVTLGNKWMQDKIGDQGGDEEDGNDRDHWAMKKVVHLTVGTQILVENEYRGAVFH